MEIAVRQNRTAEFEQYLKSLISELKITKIEQMLSDAFDSLPENTPLDYIYELNKNE